MTRTEGTSALKRDERYTLADWRSWPSDERWELIDGIAYGMSPAPRVPHQEKAGVREYWIVQPETGTVFQYVRDGALFAPVKEHRRGVAVHSSIFEGFSWNCP